MFGIKTIKYENIKHYYTCSKSFINSEHCTATDTKQTQCKWSLLVSFNATVMSILNKMNNEESKRRSLGMEHASLQLNLPLPLQQQLFEGLIM